MHIRKEKYKKELITICILTDLNVMIKPLERAYHKELINPR